MPNLGFWEILIILLVIVLLFGAKRLPELARSLGRSSRIFKSEMDEMKRENTEAKQQPAEIEQNRTDQQESTEGFWDRPENQPRPHQQ